MALTLQAFIFVYNVSEYTLLGFSSWLNTVTNT